MATLTTPDEGMRQDFQAGLGLAQGFMGNYWKAKENQVEQDRYRAGQALRDVQLSLYQTNLETVRNAATLQAQIRAAAPGLYGLAANAQANGWNAESKLKVVEYFKANPWIGNTDIAKSILGMFAESEKYERELNFLKLKQEGDLEVAKARAERAERNVQPEYFVNKVGEPMEVTAGGAARPIPVFSAVEQADIESTIRMLTKAVEDVSAGPRRDAAVKARDEYVAGKRAEEARRKEELRNRINGSGNAQSAPSDTEARTWQQMIAGQDPNMTGQIPTSKPAGGFKIRLKGQ